MDKKNKDEKNAKIDEHLMKVFVIDQITSSLLHQKQIVDDHKAEV